MNVWAVQWTKEGRRVLKKFEEDKPTNAVEFGKKLKRRGIEVDVMSRRRAFPPPLRAQAPDRPGLLWCPYCVKWRIFEELELYVKSLGVKLPAVLRCTVCSISFRDAYVRMYNPMVVATYEVKQEMKAKAKELARQKKKEKMKRDPRGSLLSRRR